MSFLSWTIKSQTLLKIKIPNLLSSIKKLQRLKMLLQRKTIFHFLMFLPNQIKIKSPLKRSKNSRKLTSITFLKISEISKNVSQRANKSHLSAVTPKR